MKYLFAILTLAFGLAGCGKPTPAFYRIPTVPALTTLTCTFTESGKEGNTVKTAAIGETISFKTSKIEFTLVLRSNGLLHYEMKLVGYSESADPDLSKGPFNHTEKNQGAVSCSAK